MCAGAASGIGREIILQLLQQNHNVYGTYRNTPVNINHKNLELIHFDVTNDFHSSFLPEIIDGIVYCPGQIILKPFHRLDTNALLDDFKIQVLGAVNVLKTCFPNLKKSENASVVLFSTVATKVGFNFHTQVAMVKGAIEGLVLSLSAEWAPTIRINAIAPSITNTPLAQPFLNSENKIKANEERHPLHKIGDPKDVAELACFLISEKAKFITAQTFVVDGGISKIIK